MPRYYRKRGFIGPVMPRRGSKAAAARQNSGQTARSVRNKNTAIATKALRIAKANAKNNEIMHWKTPLTSLSFNNASAWTVDGINMTTAATGAGWNANYSGSKTGVVAYTIGRMNRATTSTVPGYRFGNEAVIRSFWLKFRLLCNATTNSRIRVMLLKVKGSIQPEDLPFYDNATTDPDLLTFTDKGKASRIQKVMFDRLVKLDSFDHNGVDQVKYFNIFKRVNTKYHYGVPTQGNAYITDDPDGLHDIAEGSPNYWLVIATDNTTASAVSVQGNMLINYLG